MSSFARIGLCLNHDLKDKEEITRVIAECVRNAGGNIVEDVSAIDALVVVGGDGTILRTVRERRNFSVPLIAINRGSVGFLTEMPMDEVQVLLPALLTGNGIIEERSILSVEVWRGDACVFHNIALNEAAISQGTIARLLDLRTSVNNEALSTYHADGLIIATPTGSTAYSLAAGGPVVHPRLSAMILTPINPHSLTQKAIVIPGESVIETEILKKKDPFLDASVSLTLDGQIYTQLEKHDVVRVRVYDETVKFLRRKQDTFFHTLRTKLRWGERI